MIGKIFVYGSLMTDFFNHKKILEGKVISRDFGYVIGTLYHLKDKGYPGFICSGNTKVYGEILEVDDFEAVREYMDILEGFHGQFTSENDYNRRLLPVYNQTTDRDETLDVYVYNQKAFNNHMDEKIVIPHGSWRLFMEEKHAERMEALG